MSLIVESCYEGGRQRENIYTYERGRDEPNIKLGEEGELK